jgi:hypothetical protein
MSKRTGRSGSIQKIPDSGRRNLLTRSGTGNVPCAVLRIPGAVVATVSRPLLDYIIPRANLGAFMELAEDD